MMVVRTTEVVGTVVVVGMNLVTSLVRVIDVVLVMPPWGGTGVPRSPGAISSRRWSPSVSDHGREKRL